MNRAFPFLVLLCMLLGSNLHSQTIDPGTYNLPDDGDILPDATFSDRNEIGADTIVNVWEGGRIGNYTEVGYGGGIVNLNGGEIGQNFTVAADGLANITSGVVRQGFQIEGGGTANISDGIFGNGLFIFANGTADISGGDLGLRIAASTDSNLTISGGVFERLDVRPNSNVVLRGNEFRLNGTSFTGSLITVDESDVFSGTFEDGTPFAVTRLDNDSNLFDIELETVTIPSPNLTPYFIDNASGAPKGLRNGQSLTLVDNGVLDNHFTAVDAVINVTGGIVGHNLELLRTDAQITGGSFGFETDAFDGTVLSISGGNFGGLEAHAGSEVDISGGTFTSAVEAKNGSKINISGGQFNGDDMSLFGYSGGEINLIGSDFILDGAELDLTTGMPLLISDRDVTLSGTYADGTTFEYFLSVRAGDDVGFAFATDSILTVSSFSAVPEPSSGLVLMFGSLLAIATRRRRSNRTH